MAECRWLLLATPWSEADVGAMTVGLVLEQKEEGGGGSVLPFLPTVCPAPR